MSKGNQNKRKPPFIKTSVTLGQYHLTLLDKEAERRGLDVDYRSVLIRRAIEVAYAHDEEKT